LLLRALGCALCAARHTERAAQATLTLGTRRIHSYTYPARSWLAAGRFEPGHLLTVRGSPVHDQRLDTSVLHGFGGELADFGEPGGAVRIEVSRLWWIV
jgi:hypothetical protein